MLSRVPRIRLEFQEPYKNIYMPAFEFLFAKNIYHVKVVWRRCPSYLLPTCILICSYVNFPIFILLSSIPSRPSSFRL